MSGENQPWPPHPTRVHKVRPGTEQEGAHGQADPSHLACIRLIAGRIMGEIRHLSLPRTSIDGVPFKSAHRHPCITEHAHSGTVFPPLVGVPGILRATQPAIPNFTLERSVAVKFAL